MAVGALVVPMMCGAGLALWLLTQHRPADPVVFVLFIAVAIAITAVPVLARILDDLRLTGTEVGGLALAGATAVDGVAWLMPAGIAAAAGDAAGLRLVLVLPFLFLMFFVVRPIYLSLLSGHGSKAGVTVVIAGLFMSAAATEWLGLHAAFGAILFGALLGQRRCTEFNRHVEKVTSVNSVVLLPVFFVTAGLNVDLASLGGAGVVELAVATFVAITSKLAGVYLGARICRVRTAEAATLAALMNARGVTEIVVLQVGLHLGILDARLYSVMVLMAVVTTAITGPLLRLTRRRLGR